MNSIDRIIEYISPIWAVARNNARVKLRAYEAAKPSRLHKFRTDRGSGDAVVGIAGDSLRVQARHLDENHDLARGVLNTLVNNIVGSGIRVEALAKDKKGEALTDFNNKLHQLFEDWMFFILGLARRIKSAMRLRALRRPRWHQLVLRVIFAMK